MSSAEEIKAEINFIASKINQFILSNVSGSPEHLYDASLHYIKSGGKRIRPFMTVKSCQLFGGIMITLGIMFLQSIVNLEFLLLYCLEMSFFPKLLKLFLLMV